MTMVDAELPDFDTLWDYDLPALTEQRFRELLPMARASGDAAYLAELLTQIARTQGLQRQFAPAHETLDEARALLRDDLYRARVRYLLERGRAYNSAGDPTRARDLFLQAWELAVARQEDFHAVDAAHMLAIAETAERALEWNLRAEASTQLRAGRWRGSLYNNLGWTYHGQGDFEAALDYFQRGLAWRQAQGEPRALRIARWCVARCLRSLGRLDEALAQQQALWDEAEAGGEPDGFICEELGECLLALGQPEEARGWFARAHAALSQDAWLAEREPGRLARLAELGT